MLRFALHCLFFLSGAAALGYQLVWAKMLSTGLGHEMPAVLAIIAAFMAGMALGAWGLDRFIPRSARAGLWLGGLELTIGAWALLMSPGIPSVNDFAQRFIGLEPGAFRHWFIAFTIPALALLPATAAMGASLPAMEKFLSALAPQNESIGSVYAANTLGAVAGTLLTPFTLMPALGFSRTCWVLAAVNGVASIGALAIGRSADSHVRANSPAAKPRKQEHADSAVRGPLPPRRLALTVFCTGLLGIAYEVAGVRVLSQVLEGTVFTYAAVLAVFLLGTAAGAAAFHRWWRGVKPVRLHACLLKRRGGRGIPWPPRAFANATDLQNIPRLRRCARRRAGGGIADGRRGLRPGHVLHGSTVQSPAPTSARAGRGPGRHAGVEHTGCGAGPGVLRSCCFPGRGRRSRWGSHASVISCWRCRTIRQSSSGSYLCSVFLPIAPIFKSLMRRPAAASSIIAKESWLP